MNANQMQEDYNAAIHFALEGADGDGLTFLRLWNEGDWAALEREFPEFKVSDSLKRPWEYMIDGLPARNDKDMLIIDKLEVSSFSLNIECPGCMTSHQNWIGDPRGESFECEGCGKALTILADATVKLT